MPWIWIMDDLQKWGMGLASSFIVAFNLWVARSISQLKKENYDQAIRMAQDYATSESIRELRSEMKSDMTELRKELQGVAQLLQRYIGESHSRRE